MLIVSYPSAWGKTLMTGRNTKPSKHLGLRFFWMHKQQIISKTSLTNDTRNNVPLQLSVDVLQQ